MFGGAIGKLLERMKGGGQQPGGSGFGGGLQNMFEGMRKPKHYGRSQNTGRSIEDAWKNRYRTDAVIARNRAAQEAAGGDQDRFFESLGKGGEFESLEGYYPEMEGEQWDQFGSYWDKKNPYEGAFGGGRGWHPGKFGSGLLKFLRGRK